MATKVMFNVVNRVVIKVYHGAHVGSMKKHSCIVVIGDHLVSMSDVGISLVRIKSISKHFASHAFKCGFQF